MVSFADGLAKRAGGACFADRQMRLGRLRADGVLAIGQHLLARHDGPRRECGDAARSLASMPARANRSRRCGECEIQEQPSFGSQTNCEFLIATEPFAQYHVVFVVADRNDPVDLAFEHDRRR
jgi:hypothetical protein